MNHWRLPTGEPIFRSPCGRSGLSAPPDVSFVESWAEVTCPECIAQRAGFPALPDVDDPGDRACQPLDADGTPEWGRVASGSHTWARDGSHRCTRCGARAARLLPPEIAIPLEHAAVAAHRIGNVREALRSGELRARMNGEPWPPAVTELEFARLSFAVEKILGTLERIEATLDERLPRRGRK